ncbi:MAG: PP2C family protein-serine/threonine phosphatase, partial [Candidatus Binataceae bacterium]
MTPLIPSTYSSIAQAQSPAFELALLSDVGTNRDNNEDACGLWVENPETALFAVADGIGGYEGGEVASAMAIEVTLEAYRESPLEWGPATRLLRAAQRANVEIHHRALAIRELCWMGTTLTAVVVSNGVLYASHVGDCRLYLIRRGRITQITKDHTAVEEQVSMGLMTPAQARRHPDRSVLTRSVGQELIVSIARITLGLEKDDRVIVCSDGLHGVLNDRELERTVRGLTAEAACRRLV